MSAYDLIVFDLDGTLVDSRRDLADSVNALLADLGSDPLSEGLIGTMVGLPFIFQTIFLGMLAGALGGLFLVAIRVRTRKDYIPYGAYLSFAAIVVVLLVS